MAVTMANTVRFGISSSIFNNLTNSIQKAYDYTLKLDRSLNDIRIVSDASAESMEKFAKYANESAKQLGASTLDYTKGALIYYQQGLSEDEVIKRTDTTIKMSNALGASTEEVSSYMTAIWNNFGKGAQNLEYYGDVITALGASTASSAAEIAGGLEKFAAVGETIGLSYEYATSALATIVATTRQSEDTVGNSLKTIFARIQGLNLGETLEDGTTLNKYSEALAKVGVSIKTESGQLKDMDTILNELGQT
jgi:TP901 family phage tail tape measure protein